MTENCSDPHKAGTCVLCRELRHPAHVRTRRTLAALPRQSSQTGTGRANGGGR